MNHFKHGVWSLLVSLILLSAHTALATDPPQPPARKQFDAYWYPNGAELSRFKLEQARYGEIHAGDAVMVFVTESLNPVLQVKADTPDVEDVPVLKLNFTRNFFTGIYPYTIMTSTFTPVDHERHPLPFKISFTAQEWCGHVFAQLNLREQGYQVQSRSYFERESDQDFAVARALPEDALWTRIRIAPQTLPTGSFQIVPGTLYTRLRHRPMTVLNVEATLEAVRGKSLEGNPLWRYTVKFKSEQRTLTILFERTFPYRIQSWQDTYPSRGRLLTTKAERTHTLMLDYWQRNQNQDRRFLRKLGLKAER